MLSEILTEILKSFLKSWNLSGNPEIFSEISRFRNLVRNFFSDQPLGINFIISALKKYMALTSQRRRGASKKETEPADVSELNQDLYENLQFICRYSIKIKFYLTVGDSLEDVVLVVVIYLISLLSV